MLASRCHVATVGDRIAENEDTKGSTTRRSIMMSSVGYRRRLLMWAGCSRYGQRLIAPLFAPSVEVYVSYLPSGEMVSADDVCCMPSQ